MNWLYEKGPAFRMLASSAASLSKPLRMRSAGTLGGLDCPAPTTSQHRLRLQDHLAQARSANRWPHPDARIAWQPDIHHADRGRSGRQPGPALPAHPCHRRPSQIDEAYRLNRRPWFRPSVEQSPFTGLIHPLEQMDVLMSCGARDHCDQIAGFVALRTIASSCYSIQD